MNELALFAGSGGGILGGHLLGWRTVAAVEIEDYPRRVLLQRQADGFLPRFPIWDDICTFDGHPWRGKVDVISGGFPCQDISAAGKGDGLDGERSGLWTEMARVVSEIRPRFVFVENSPMLTSRGGVRVIADLTSLGYDCRWTVMGAANVGAPHQRDRIWIVARQREFLSHSQHHRNGWGEQQSQSPQKEDGNVANPNSGMRGGRRAVEQSGEDPIRGLHTQEAEQTPHDVWSETFGCRSIRAEEKVSNPTGIRPQGQGKHEQSISSEKSGNRQTNIIEPISSSNFWSVEPNVGRVADGVAHRVDRLKAIGNGQVPLCAATAWRLLTKDWELML